MMCLKNNTYAMSEFCLEAWSNGIMGNETDNCYPQRSVFGMISGIWCMVNGGIGFIGNFLTLIAIPFCARKKL